MRSHGPDDAADDDLEIVRADVTSLPAGADALAHVVAQSNREAQANRAQARELIKALESVQRSQEYLGTALRDERRKSRWLVVVLLVAPVVVGLAVWHVAGRVDDAKASMDQRLDLLARETAAARAEDAGRFRDARIDELVSDLDALHRDLDASREALAAERRHVASREEALANAITRTDSVKMEIGALEFEVKSAKAKAGAEQARAAQLEKRIDELAAELDRARKPTAGAARPAVPPAPVSSDASSGPRPDPSPPTAAAASAAPTGPPTEPPTSAQRDEAEKARLALNALLAESPDAVRYRFASIGGVAGRSYARVEIVGTDQAGAVLRTIHADKADISVDGATGSVVIRCTGGKLVVGAVEAPFFGGTYGLVVRGDAERWTRSGLAAAE